VKAEVEEETKDGGIRKRRQTLTLALAMVMKGDDCEQLIILVLRERERERERESAFTLGPRATCPCSWLSRPQGYLHLYHHIDLQRYFRGERKAY
jgi:hypothetical protein